MLEATLIGEVPVVTVEINWPAVTVDPPKIVNAPLLSRFAISVSPPYHLNAYELFCGTDHHKESSAPTPDA